MSDNFLWKFEGMEVLAPTPSKETQRSKEPTDI